MKKAIKVIGALGAALGAMISGTSVPAGMTTHTSTAQQQIQPAKPGAEPVRQAPAPQSPIRASYLANLLRGGGGGPWSSGGHTPYEWGTSRACARMRRKNRLRSAGLGGQRI